MVTIIDLLLFQVYRVEKPKGVAMRKMCTLFLLILLAFPGQGTGQSGGTAMSKKSEVSGTAQANHLVNEKSPYLLQHAYNPVDWYPWGEEALAKAVLEEKPIFLSIGYSTCHWCHVMAHESFENPEIAAFLNKYFISIKVDREERPDLDQIYMAATQAMTGSGGWPMSLFLFPDTRPFYAGTYFPPHASYGRPGFMEILEAIKTAWLTDRVSLSLSAEQITSQLRKERGESVGLQRSWLDKGFSQIEESYEPKYGGFAQAPKFPRPVTLDFLLRYYRATGEKSARDMALHTLEQMAGGGIYDQIGGGFHRYSVDAQWRIPHFEKMLYDQSQLVFSYLSAYQLTGSSLYSQTVRHTLDYVLREMQAPEGGFYSAEDADSVNPYDTSEHSEGAFYLWTAEEINALLPAAQASLFRARYGVENDGNALHDPQQEFTGRNILYQKQDLAELSRMAGMSEEEAMKLLDDARQRLLTQREKRTAPHLDDKVITAWNGLMISAFARAAMILEDERYLQAANHAADFLLKELFVDGKLIRRWREGEARYDAGLDDYSFLAQGLLDLYGASHELARLQTAEKLTEQMISTFADPKGGFFDTAEDSQLLARMKEAYDGAEPSGNSVAVMNLLRLSELTGRTEWGVRARKGIESFGKTLEAYAPAMPMMLSAVDLQLDKPRQIVIAGARGADDTRELLREVHGRYLPNTSVTLADGEENQEYLAQRLPFLATVDRMDGKATAYVCEDFSCKMPVNTREGLARILDGKSVQ
jgi:uncharacterized protein YyaL (SSP411 family)